MSFLGRRGCLWLLGMILIVTLLVTLGLATSARQISAGWSIPLGRGYVVMGRIVTNSYCRRLQIAGFVETCPRQYGIVIYLPQLGPATESTLITIPDSWLP